MQDLPAALGGAPLSDHPLHIVRPRFPPLETFSAEFRDALASGAVTNNGPHVRAFEEQLAQYLGVPDAVSCTNGQSALMLMLRAAGIENGEVITPSYTFSATPHAVRWCGAEPVFADISPSSLCLDPGDVESRITERTKAFLAVDVYGIACDYEAFDRLGERYGIEILYDSAPAFGTRVGGEPIGGFGRAQSFSFHATKAFCTMEGGCLTSNDTELLQRAKALRNFGQTAGAECDEPGFNAKMTEVCALIGRQQLETFDVVVAHRIDIANRMRAGLEDLPGVTFAEPGTAQAPVWLYFPIIIDETSFGLNRDQLAAALEAENLHVRKYFELPCHHMKAYAAHAKVKLPVTENVAYRVVSLPIYNDMTDTECDLFIQGIRRCHEHSTAIAGATR